MKVKDVSAELAKQAIRWITSEIDTKQWRSEMESLLNEWGKFCHEQGRQEGRETGRIEATVLPAEEAPVAGRGARERGEA